MQGFILFVDDDEAILNTMLRIFQKAGFHCFTAKEGNDALDVLAHNQIDIVMTDSRMPGMNGYALLKQVRKMNPLIIRIIISGYSEHDPQIRAEENKAAQLCISKPWNTNTLIRQISTLLFLSEILKDSALQQLTRQLGTTLEPSELYTGLSRLLPEQSVSRCINQYPEEAAALLHTAGRAFRDSSLSTVSQVVNTLTNEQIQHILLLNKLNDNTPSRNKIYTPKLLLAHACSCNTILIRLHKLIFTVTLPPEFATAGLLHDAGKWLCAHLFSGELPAGTEPGNIPRGKAGLKIERTLLGYDHSQLGAWWLNRHNISPWLSEACLFHHNPLEPAVFHRPILSLLHLADLYSWQQISGTPYEVPDTALLEELNLCPRDIAELYTRCTAYGKYEYDKL